MFDVLPQKGRVSFSLEAGEAGVGRGVHKKGGGAFADGGGVGAS